MDNFEILIMQKNIDYINIHKTNEKLRAEIEEKDKLISELKISEMNYREEVFEWQQSYIDLQKKTDQLRSSNKKRGEKIENLEYYLKNLLKSKTTSDEEVNHLQQSYRELQETYEYLKITKKSSEKQQLNPFKKNDKRKRGGCKLTDNEIVRLLKIFAKRGKYANLDLTQAIKEVSQTHQTYYRVVKRNYSSEATNLRIERLALDNYISLPERGKLR